MHITRAHVDLAEYFLKQADPNGDLSFVGNFPRAFKEVCYHMNWGRNKEEKVVSILTSVECILASSSPPSHSLASLPLYDYK